MHNEVTPSRPLPLCLTDLSSPASSDNSLTPTTALPPSITTFSHVVIRDREATFHWCQRLSGGRGRGYQHSAANMASCPSPLLRLTLRVLAHCLHHLLSSSSLSFLSGFFLSSAPYLIISFPIPSSYLIISLYFHFLPSVVIFSFSCFSFIFSFHSFISCFLKPAPLNHLLFLFYLSCPYPHFLFCIRLYQSHYSLNSLNVHSFLPITHSP